MTAKMLPTTRDNFRQFSDQLSYLQVRTDGLSKVLERVSKKSPQPARAGVEESYQTLAKLSQRLSDLHINLRRRPSDSSVRRLSTEALVQLVAVCEQCDGVLDTINNTRSATSIQRCTTSLLVVSSTIAVALQCLRHAQFLDKLPDVIDREQQEQARASRAKLERYVVDQQEFIRQWLTNDLNVAIEKRNPQPSARGTSRDLKKETLLALLHPSLLRSNQWMYAKIGPKQIENIAEGFSQKLLLSWVSLPDMNDVRPVAFTHVMPPGQAIPSPKRSRSSMPEALPIRLISPQISRDDPSTAAALHRTRRYSTTTTSPIMTNAIPILQHSRGPTTSPIMTNAIPILQHSRGPTSSFQASSLPLSPLREPPFVVTHARAIEQARLNAQAQASIQTQAQARRASTSSNHPPPPPYHQHPRPSSKNFDNCPASPASEASSLAPTARPEDIVVSWRLSALGQHWDYENDELTHNTGCVSPSGARSDRHATTEIRKSLLTPEALKQVLGDGVRWQTVERKVLNGDKSQRKKFVSVPFAMGWREVEALVRRSGELCE